MQISLANNWNYRTGKLGSHNHLVELENAEKQKACVELEKQAATCNNQTLVA